MKLDRRSFLHTSAGVAALPMIASRNPLGANDTLRVGVVGIRSRGKAHIRGLDRLDGVRVTALCDVDSKVLAREANALAKRRAKKRGKPSDSNRVATYADIRRMLEDDVVDIVSLATPNHVHALHAIWAIFGDRHRGRHSTGATAYRSAAGHNRWIRSAADPHR